MPGPDGLSREELLALLAAREASEAAKDARIDALLAQVGELTAQVQALVLKLSKDSSTSSKPPSSDGPQRRPQGGSARERSGRKAGKQPGEPGTTLRLVEDPDERIAIPAPATCSCGSWLVEEPVVALRRRQVHDLAPIPDPVVREYAADVKCCPGCQANVTGEFPAGVNAPAQYGPQITTRVADMVIGHHVPIHRATVLVMGSEAVHAAAVDGFVFWTTTADDPALRAADQSGAPVAEQGGPSLPGVSTVAIDDTAAARAITTTALQDARVLGAPKATGVNHATPDNTRSTRTSDATSFRRPRGSHRHSNPR